MAYLTGINDDLTNLLYDTIEGYQKMVVYNNRIKRPFQKIWVLTPKLRTLNKIYIPQGGKTGLLSLVLFEEDPEALQLKKFIERLEEKIGENVENLQLKSSVKNYDKFYPTLTVQMPFTRKDDQVVFDCNIYDENNQKISYREIKPGSYVKAFIEVSYVWLGETEFGVNLKVFQMKSFPELDLQNCLFEDAPKPVLSPTLPSPPSFLREIKERVVREEPPSKQSFVPTVQDLLSIKLRPIQPEPPKKRMVKKKVMRKVVKKKTLGQD